MQPTKERNQETMKKQTLGKRIASLRKENGMTQMELAEKMGVTDKAVSKWERDLSIPDINSISTLADTLGVSVDSLIQIKQDEVTEEHTQDSILDIIFKAVALAMGVAVAVLSFLGQLETTSAIGMLGIGLASLAISTLRTRD